MKEKKFIVFIVCFIVLVELIVFFTAYGISGKKKWIQVHSASGELVYEVKGDRLPSFDKYYFENNFGPLKNYDLKLIEKEIPFPVRGWLFASIGFPVGLSFVLLFVLKVLTMIFPSLKNKFSMDSSGEINTGFFKSKNFKKNISNFYFLGIILFALSFIIWALPIIFNSATERFLYQISKYPLIFGVFFGGVLVCFLYVIHLRFKLKKYDIDKNHTLELERIKMSSNLLTGSGLKEKEFYLENKINDHDLNGDEN